MPKIAYVAKKFGAASLLIIENSNVIIAEYAAQGYDLTLRQLYYQHVARGLLANNDKSYDRLGAIISDARRAGLIDWNSIVDRTRYVRTPASWSGPDAIIEASAAQYSIDFWAAQDYRAEVWVEKDALVSVLEVACRPWHVPFFSCRGYTSDSEIWAAAQRIRKVMAAKQSAVIIHLGDHDPSGIDMSRDITDRLNMFVGSKVEVRRIALNMAQVRQYNPPPNPAKLTDTRYASYRQRYGASSWELDALNPTTITDLIEAQIRGLIDPLAWEVDEIRCDEGKRLLQAVSSRWGELTSKL